MQPFTLPDFYVPWPARKNQNLDAARAHTKAWAREVGILGDPAQKDSDQIWDEKGFDRHDYALFCAYVHPDAPVQELELMTDWNVWAFYVDDYFLNIYKRPKDHLGAKAYLDRVLVFMPVDLAPSPTPINPMERGLTDLWQRTAPVKSEAWRRRIVESMKSLLEAFLWELDSMSQNRLANPIEYIEMRRQVGAALWSADLVEHAMFLEIPERVVCTHTIQSLKNTFADAVHLRNDIFSYQREVLKEGELTNAVLVFERFLEVDTQSAVNLTNDLLTSRLQQFEHTALTELPLMFQEYALTPIEQTNVLEYVRGLQDWQSGAHEWHVRTSRYLNPQQGTIADPGRVSPSGLGRMRLSSDSLGLNRFKNYQHVPYQKVETVPLPAFYMPFETTINPCLDAVREQARDWASQMGIVVSRFGTPGDFAWDLRWFYAIDSAFFNAMARPNATESQLLLDVCWMVWAVYSDDYFTEVFGSTRDFPGAKIFQARLLGCMPVQPGAPVITPVTPVERGLSDLWSQTTGNVSPEARLTLRNAVEEMIASWLWELSKRIQNHIADPIDYLEMRRKTSGSDYFLIFSRMLQGQEAVLPGVYRTCALQSLTHAAIDHVCFINDMVSYQKEMEFEGDLHNIVLVIQNFLGCERARAVDIVNRLMTARIKQFEYIVRVEFPSLVADFQLDDESHQQLLAYAESLKNFMSASLRWHTSTRRYHEDELWRKSKPDLAHPAGLGTSAARISEALGRDLSMLAQPAETIPRETRLFALSHLSLPFGKNKEEKSG